MSVWGDGKGFMTGRPPIDRLGDSLQQHDITTVTKEARATPKRQRGQRERAAKGRARHGTARQRAYTTEGKEKKMLLCT
jgi:hypothetical protein